MPTIEWTDYSIQFRRTASLHRLDDDYVATCLQYAKSLNDRGLPIIFDLPHLSRLVGLDERYLRGAAYCSARYYRTFVVPKRSGGHRTISEPLPNLKRVQHWILENVLPDQVPSPFAKGFVKGKSIKENARFHKAQRFVLSLDVEDFFPSITRKRVFRLFRLFGYTVPLADTLSRLCTLNERLPQGAPTSPAIANLICSKLDARLAGYARRLSLRYTRYADDLTFSGDFHPGHVISFVRKVCVEEGFRLNPNKIRLMARHQRQEVTGVVVNEKLQASLDLRRELRQATYFIRKFGLNSHIERVGIRRAHYVEHLLGIATHIRFLNPGDSDAKAALTLLHPLVTRRVMEEVEAR